MDTNGGMRINLYLEAAADWALFEALKDMPVRRRAERVRQLAAKGIEYELMAQSALRSPTMEGHARQSTSKEAPSLTPHSARPAAVGIRGAPESASVQAAPMASEQDRSAFGNALADLEF